MVLVKDSIKLSAGILYFMFTQKNWEKSYQAMIRLYCRTKGFSRQILAKMLSVIHPARVRAENPGILGRMNESELHHITETLHQDGYYIFEQRLSEELIQELIQVTKTTPALLRKMDQQSGEMKVKREIYNPSQVQAVRYDYESNELLKSKVVQKLISDLSVQAVAKSYLNANPIMDIVTMWWHTDFQKTPDSNAAQYYHFDMDRIKWLKFFFYLTDVNTDTGPHCFIRGTHQAQNIPQEILNQGYVRITDDQIQKHFRPEDIKEFSGPRGTIIAEDTSGLHKGKHVHSGHRLIFQLEFAVSMFGSPSADTFKLSRVMEPELAQNMKDEPRIFKNFSFND